MTIIQSVTYEHGTKPRLIRRLKGPRGSLAMMIENDAVKASQSQALVDSIEDLISLERDVSSAISSISLTPTPVMVPLSPVGFMPGMIVGGNVMVSLGQDYYVERTPQQARDILERRISDLAEKARGLESDVLLMLARKDTGNGEVVVDLERKRRATRQRPDSNGSWVKGFLSGGTLDKPTGRPSRGRDVLTGVTDTCADKKEPQLSTQTKEITLEDADGDKEVVNVRGESEEPIMEIREWLDSSGNQTSVDVTNLGKVLEKMPQALAEGTSLGGGKHVTLDTSVVHVADPAGKTHKSDLNSVLEKLEKQEEVAEEESKQATNPSLGSQWKKGFLSGKSAYSVSRQPSAMVPVETQTQVTIPQAQVQAEESNVSSNAFEGNVVEKSKNTVACLASLRTPLATAGTSPRVSRFKARRQGL